MADRKNSLTRAAVAALPAAAAASVLVGAFAIAPVMAQDVALAWTGVGPDWRVPRLPNGRPDLQGIWTNKTVTPLERPVELGDRAFFTQQEAQDFVERRRAGGDRDVRTDDVWDVLWAYNDFWWDSGDELLPNLRTSIVTDPPNGRVPPLIPQREAELRAEAEAIRIRCAEGPGCAPNNAGQPAPAWDPQVLDLMTRCISFGTVVPMLPTAYNNNYQIVQSDDTVAILTEMVHQVRRIPTDGRAHAPSSVRQWFGDPVGRWEGDTFVVESTNFVGEYQGRLRAADEQLRVVERFTRVAPDILLYEFTVDNPTVWTRPWSGEIPFVRSDGLLYEYACHEGNRGLENILSAMRAEMAQDGAGR
jgi:hypothetical protein